MNHEPPANGEEFRWYRRRFASNPDKQVSSIGRNSLTDMFRLKECAGQARLPAVRQIYGSPSSSDPNRRGGETRSGSPGLTVQPRRSRVERPPRPVRSSGIPSGVSVPGAENPVHPCHGCLITRTRGPAPREYERHHNGHRPHRDISNARPRQPLPEPITDPAALTQLQVHRHDRLGGPLHEYEDAWLPARRVSPLRSRRRSGRMYSDTGSDCRPPVPECDLVGGPL
jgi:hypothetical protein